MAIHKTGARSLLLASGLALLLGLAITYASGTEVTHSLPGTVRVIVLPIQWSADIDLNGRVDRGDLVAVATRLNTAVAPGEREDINHDGAIDVLDLAIVARYLGEDVEL